MRCLRPLHVVMLSALTGCAQCPDPFSPPGSPVTSLHYPTGMALHPSLPVLFVASSNFDLAYSSGAVLAANLDYLYAQLALHDKLQDPVADPWQAAARVPSLGGPLLFGPRGDVLFHLTRQDNRLVQLDVASSLAGLSITCGNAQDALPQCLEGDHVLTLDQVDPYGLAMEDLGDHLRLYVGVLHSGHVLGVDHLSGTSGPRFSVAFDKNLGDTNRGGSLAVLPSTHGQAPYLFSTGRDYPGNNLQLGTVRQFSLWEDPNTAAILSMDLFGQGGSADVRGLIFNEDGTRGWFISKIPAALFEVDLTRAPNGIPAGVVIRVVPLGKEPSTLALFTPPQGPPLLLTVSFRDQEMLALDATTLELVGSIRGLCNSPYDILADNVHGFAFVSCFNDDTVKVVRLPQAQDPRFEVAATLGSPRDTTVTNPQLPGFLPSIPNLP